MCRNIKQLRRAGDPPTQEEIELAALQFVRKVSGYRAPSRKNQAAFEQAVAEIAAATRGLIERIEENTHSMYTTQAGTDRSNAISQSGVGFDLREK